MSSSLDHKCQRCGSQYHGQVCPFCTITGLDVNALLASEGLTMPQTDSGAHPAVVDKASATLVDVVSNRTFPVTAPVCRFGRDISNDIVLTGDKSLSRFHFQVTVSNGEYFVEDAGSRNGTFLNGSPCTAPRKVENGDIISAGMSRYRLTVKDPNEIGEEIPSGNGHSAHGHEVEASVGAVESSGSRAAAAPPVIEDVDGAGHTPVVYDLDLQMETAAATEHRMETTGDRGQALSSSPAESSQSEPPEQSEQQFDSVMDALQPPPAALEIPPPPTPQATEPRIQRMPLGNKPEADAASSSIDVLLPGKEDELGDTASRFLKLAQSPLDSLWPEGAPEPDLGEPARPGARKRRTDNHEWPQWCTEFTFSELDELRQHITSIEAEIATKQAELTQLADTLDNAEGLKNRLLATRDNEMVEACSAVFRGLGWETQLNAGTSDELVLSSGGTALAIAKIVSTDAQPKANVFANLVGSLSTYWSEHGVEPKGILLVAFHTDGPPQDRPELSPDLASYASKKNLCLMNSLQLLSIYREAALRRADVESIKSAILNASGMLEGFELSTAPAQA